MNARQLRRQQRRQAHDDRMAANRANAAHSTGPRTEEGKAISSQNNFRHGFTGAFCVLPSEDRAAFDRLTADLNSEHNPQTPTETLLVSDLLRHHWLVQRSLCLQEKCWAQPEVDQKQLALLIRYQTTNQRAFHRCLNDLLRFRKQRVSEQRGFESQKRQQAAQEAAEQRRSAAERRREEQHAWAQALRQLKEETARSRQSQGPQRKQNIQPPPNLPASALTVLA